MTTTRQSNFAAKIRTTLLLATLSGLLVVIGFAVGGVQGGIVFLGLSLLFNLGAYWFSDKLAIRSARATPISDNDMPKLHQLVQELSTRAGLPMPRLYLIPSDQPNAFATGRNAKKSAVAVTKGLMNTLSEEELSGVIAHELAHIRNRDILTQSVAAAIGSAITWIAYMLLWVGGGSNNALGVIGSLAMVLLAPLAAGLIQMAVSRQREFAADATGASICGNPEWLASALLRLEAGTAATPMKVNEATESMYIVKPIRNKGGFHKLFSTHPPTEERVSRLRQMRPSL